MQVEGDAQLVFNPLMRRDLHTIWAIEAIIIDILALSSSFGSVSFCWVCKNVNEVVHALCQWNLVLLLLFNEGFSKQKRKQDITFCHI